MTPDKKIRIGITGFAQMHVTTIMKSFAAYTDRVEWTAAADVPPLTENITTHPGTRKSNMDAALKICGFSAITDDYNDVINENPDLIIVCAENYIHGELCEKILEKGISVIIEKPMASSLDDALRMARAAKAGKADLIINWPVAWWPAFRLAQELTEKGAAGNVFKFHYRNRSSLGPYCYGNREMPESEKKGEWWYQKEPGGGAMLDYCCYGCSLSRWFVGRRPEAVFAMKMNAMSNFAPVEDYSAMMIRYPEAVALIEGSWATVSGGGVHNGPIVFGDRGTIVSDRYSSKVLVYNKLHGNDPDGVYESSPLTPGRDNIAAEYFNHIDKGEPVHPLLDIPLNIDAMAALDAGIRSAASGKLELTGNSFWVV
ncbi:MAG: Gfo/Idh/MocA family oxidoreductase [Eubacteriales bacterium]|nr:Gfo/Idh/MocA family oxidoreductase [Eubacteriales bacterium]